MTVDELQVLITANTDELRKEIARTNSMITGLKKTTEKAQSGITSTFKKLKTGIIALGIGKIIKESITTGMDAVESDSLFETSLGDMADSVREWSNEIGDALGVNAVSIRKNTGVIYNMTSSMGVAKDNALKLGKGISLLSEDMASFYNLDSAEAFNKLRAGLTGETEPLKALGILVDENTIKQVAYSEGIAQNGAELTQQQKVLARYVAILKQTGNAQGDLARTLNSPANLMRLFKNQVSQLGLAFSNFLLPVLQAVLPYFTAFTKVVTLALNSLAKFMGLKNTSASDETDKINSNIGGLGSSLDNADKKAKKLKSTLAGFDEMNVLQDKSNDSSSTGSSVGISTGLDFDLSEYDAHLDWVSSKTDAIVENMKEAFSEVKDIVTSIWNSEPVQVFAEAVTSYGQFIWDYWNTLGPTLVENITTTWGNIETNVSTIGTNITKLWTTMWSDINAGIQKWGQPIIDGVNGVFNSIWIDAIDPYIQLITKQWADFSGMLVELWNEHGKPLIDNIGEFVTKTIDLFQSIWDNVIEPIITPFLETLSWLWDEHLKDMIKSIGDLVGSVINGALEIYNKFIEPIVSWLLSVLAPAWAFLSTTVIGIVGTIIGVISDLITGITKVLRGIVDFIVGVFTLNWEKAWDGVKSIFTGIWDALTGVVKGVINVIIDVLNGFVGGINKIGFDVPDWVPIIGGKRWGFDIPKIPKMAQGGIVDKPTQAIIGEAGKEAVLPLENNTGWMDTFAEKLANKIGGNSNPIQLVINLGDETLFDKFIRILKDKDFETNGEVLDL